MEDYDSYSSAAAASAAAPSEDGMHEPETEKEDAAEEGAESGALLPKSILAGKDFKVGDEVVLKITHLYEDQVEVSYAPEKPEMKE